MNGDAELTPVSAALSAAPAQGSLFADRYEVGRILGQGGMSIVFAATHLPSEYPVAIKLLLSNLSAMPDATQRLAREARVTARVKHPNIVEIYDVGETGDGKVFLVMEYLRGKPLSQWWRGEERTPPEETLNILLQAMEGIASAHDAGVIHRDLKPDNIFVCCDETGKHLSAKVLDFGVSKLVDHMPDVSDASITQTGMMVGTPYYMAPEQIRDSRAVDHRADVYALGVIVYEMFTGGVPFRSTNFGDLLIEIMQRGIPSLRTERPELPPELISAVDRAVSLEPEDRFGDVQSFIEALRPFASLPGLAAQDSRVSAIPTATATRSGIGPMPEWHEIPPELAIVPTPEPVEIPEPEPDSVGEAAVLRLKRRKIGTAVVAATLLFGCLVGVLAALSTTDDSNSKAAVETKALTPPVARSEPEPVRVATPAEAKAEIPSVEEEPQPAAPEATPPASEAVSEPKFVKAAIEAQPRTEAPPRDKRAIRAPRTKLAEVVAKQAPVPEKAAAPPPAAAKVAPAPPRNPPRPAARQEPPVGRSGASVSADEF